MNKMNKISIPDWCDNMPNSTKLYSEDILEFYGLKSTRKNAHNIHREINSGRIPKPLELKIKGVTRKNYWLLGDMRKLKSEEL